jgi:uncharacterized membrane protein
MKLFLQFLTVLVVFLAIDLVWLGLIAKNLYSKYLGYIMTPNVNWIAAFTFYFIFIVGLMFFVINPAIEKQSFMYALLVGGLFGFITYSTYDLTNLATLKDWPITITVIDLIWGTVLSASVSSVSYWIITTFIL